MNDNLTFTLENCVDQHGIRTVVDRLAWICYEKAEHVRASYDDEITAGILESNGDIISEALGPLEDL